VNVRDGVLRDDGEEPAEDAVLREAEALYPQLCREIGFKQSIPFASSTTGRRILDASADVQAAVVQVACRQILRATQDRNRPFGHELAREVLKHLLKRRIAAPSRRVVAILGICTAVGNGYDHFLPMMSLLRLVSMPPTAGEVEALQALRAEMAGSTYRGPRKIVERIDEILRADERTLLPGGTWSARVLADIAGFDPKARDAWCELVMHLLAIGSAEPSTRWETQLQQHLQAVGPRHFLERTLDWLALGPMPDQPSLPQVPEGDADYLKGFVWALSACDQPNVRRALADLAEQCLKKIPNHGAVCARVGNACIRVLTRLSGTESVAQLGRLATRVKYVAGLRLVEQGLADIAAQMGITPEELEEIAVPTSDRDQKGVLQAQKVRLERSLESTRLIPFDHWQERYARHPLIGDLSRRLIWQFSDGDRVQLGAFSDGHLVTVDDRPLDGVSSASTVHLWHPIGDPPDVVMAWRRWLDRHAVVQPFKQAHREIYILTDAERATGDYSNRFAGHIIRQHQFAALCRERGWGYRLQGDWDSANTPVRSLPRWGLSIEFWVEAPTDRAGMAQSGAFQFVFTDRVRFTRNGMPVRLEDVPPIAFSEGLRDIDLFVAVCSVGNDPTWADRGPDRYSQYWREFAFATELSEVAKTRRAVLEALVPRLTIADRLSLTDRFLVVRGDLATYKIHLGSGNVLMEPGSQYLCIVPARGNKLGRDIWLPFEGDMGFSIILSKALMLADDKNITDPLIVQQIRRAAVL
jgi:hypothetical protein